jgi:hypothetical protein
LLDTLTLTRELFTMLMLQSLLDIVSKELFDINGVSAVRTSDMGR